MRSSLRFTVLLATFLAHLPLAAMADGPNDEQRALCGTGRVRWVPAGDGWKASTARVGREVVVERGGVICQRAVVGGHVRVSGVVRGQARVSGPGSLRELAESGWTEIQGDVADSALVRCGSEQNHGYGNCPKIRQGARVYAHALIEGNALIDGTVWGYAQIIGNVHVASRANVGGSARWLDRADSSQYPENRTHSLIQESTDQSQQPVVARWVFQGGRFISVRTRAEEATAAAEGARQRRAEAAAAEARRRAEAAAEERRRSEERRRVGRVCRDNTQCAPSQGIICVLEHSRNHTSQYGRCQYRCENDSHCASGRICVRESTYNYTAPYGTCQ